MKQILQKLIQSIETSLLSSVCLYEFGMSSVERRLFLKTQFPYHWEQEEAIFLASITHLKHNDINQPEN